ncbi:MAG TPA: glycosyltransferase family 39 protein [Blastocatellia bacterium]|jgi:hypothetical protein|nr:glycosyltransferase family 39 protein [Blastocatellia bacterium]
MACSLTFLAALGVRLLYFQDSRAEQLYGETFSTNLVYSYEQEATRITTKGGLLYPNEELKEGDARLISHPPGYAFLLAAVQGNQPSDRSRTLMRLIQSVLSSAAAVLVVLIAAELLALPIAFVSGLLIAFSPHLAWYSLWLSPDSLSVIPILIAVYLLIKASRSSGLVAVVLAGLLIGLSCWLRSNVLLLAPFLFLLNLVLFRPPKRAISLTAVLVASTCLMIMPLTIRNWVLFGRFIPLSLGVGVIMLEGIAEYDTDGKFNLPVYDEGLTSMEAEAHGRPDYRGDLWNPDGVERERERLERSIGAIRSDVPWFIGVMFQRMAFMVRYNDFDPKHQPFNTTLAPSVAEGPGYGHTTDVPGTGEPASLFTPAEALAHGTRSSEGAKLALLDEGDWFELQGDESISREQFVFPPFAVRKNTDYLVKVPILIRQGKFDLRIRNADGRTTLAQISLQPPPPRKKKNKRKVQDAVDPQPSTPVAKEPVAIQIPFASDREELVYLTFNNNGNGFEYPVAEAGRAELHEVGATPYLWTRYPRALTRGIQKNVFTTSRMRVLIVVGLLLLALAKPRRVLVILLAVPAYYLMVQSVLHTETRYILAIHYFLFVAAAVTLYISGVIIAAGFNRIRSRQMRSESPA